MVVLEAPAKLTLSLRVLGRRDDGYHLIDAEMVTIDLHDSIRIDDTGDGLEIVDEHGRPVAGVGVGPDNLVARALRAVGRTARVTITKRIPPGAGLGGGSPDGAAVLRWAGSTDLGQAAAIGADVAFCLIGGRARVGGIGEVVEPLPHEPRRLTVLTPPIHCDTAAVYGEWDRLGGPAGEHGNDLEPAALSLYPDLARWRGELGDDAGTSPRLAGSGSSFFVDGEYPGAHRTIVTTVPAP